MKFDHADGLHSKKKETTQFELAGIDGKFYPAKAVIKNNTVILTSSQVSESVQVRYAWKNNLQADLFNSAGWPASSFISNIKK